MNLLRKKNKETVKGTGVGLDFPRPIDERIAVLEMLLWKYHSKGIPVDVWERMKKNGFVEDYPDGTGGWTKITDVLGKKFNETFNY